MLGETSIARSGQCRWYRKREREIGSKGEREEERETEGEGDRKSGEGDKGGGGVKRERGKKGKDVLKNKCRTIQWAGTDVRTVRLS